MHAAVAGPSLLQATSRDSGSLPRSVDLWSLCADSTSAFTQPLPNFNIFDLGYLTGQTRVSFRAGTSRLWFARSGMQRRTAEQRLSVSDLWSLNSNFWSTQGDHPPGRSRARGRLSLPPQGWFYWFIFQTCTAWYNLKFHTSKNLSAQWNSTRNNCSQRILNMNEYNWSNWVHSPPFFISGQGGREYYPNNLDYWSLIFPGWIMLNRQVQDGSVHQRLRYSSEGRRGDEGMDCDEGTYLYWSVYVFDNSLILHACLVYQRRFIHWVVCENHFPKLDWWTLRFWIFVKISKKILLSLKCKVENLIY